MESEQGQDHRDIGSGDFPAVRRASPVRFGPGAFERRQADQPFGVPVKRNCPGLAVEELLGALLAELRP